MLCSVISEESKTGAEAWPVNVHGLQRSYHRVRVQQACGSISSGCSLHIARAGYRAPSHKPSVASGSYSSPLSTSTVVVPEVQAVRHDLMPLPVPPLAVKGKPFISLDRGINRSGNRKEVAPKATIMGPSVVPLAFCSSPQSLIYTGLSIFVCFTD